MKSALFRKDGLGTAVGRLSQKHPENRKPYHSVKINLKKSTTLYLNITGGYEKPIGTAHVFLLRGAISSEAKQLSSTVSVTIREGNGQQVLS